MTETVGSTIERFLEHKRELGRKYNSEEHELRLVVRFAESRGVGELNQLTRLLLEDFLASRPRHRPRSFNHLLGVIRGLLDWAVTNELLTASPLAARPRRVTSSRLPFIFDTVQARRCWRLRPLSQTTSGPDVSRHLRPLLRAGTACR